MNNKGFTMVELLAVMLILVIISLVAFPSVLNITKNVKNNDNLYKTIYMAAETYIYNENKIIDDDEFYVNIIDLINNEYLKNNITNPENGEKFASDDYVVVTKKDDMTLSFKIEKKQFGYKDESGAPQPYLTEGMIPVIIENDGSLKKADINSKWYDYKNKKWANVVLVDKSVRNEYINATAGTSIDTSKVLAYYVWIPRYKYQIFSDISNIKILQDYNTNISKEISIVFEDKNTKKSYGTKKGEWLTHPAFTFGGKELNGIWVGKFETTGTNDNPTILPYTQTKVVQSLVNQSVSEQFKTSLKFAGNTLNNDGSISHINNTTYGVNDIDAHMMKNIEWGAVAYLTNSLYGRCINGVCAEVRINNSRNLYTGCAATTEAKTKNGNDSEYLNQTDGSEGWTWNCENEYNTNIGFLASTTGNITGIYDMSGGAMEIMMGVLEDSLGSKTPMSGKSASDNSGFTGKLSDGTTLNGISLPENKYYDIYTYNTDGIDGIINYGYLGDATIELESFSKNDNNASNRYSNWNNDSAQPIYNIWPWIARGGYWYVGSAAGIFNFTNSTGSSLNARSFRSVLVK